MIIDDSAALVVHCIDAPAAAVIAILGIEPARV